MKTTISCFSALFLCATACADELVNLVNVQCLPEIDALIVTTPSFYNVIDNREEQFEKLNAKGFFTLAQLQTNPQTCSLRRGEVRVEITDFKATSSMRCGASPFARGRVILTGQGRFDFTAGVAFDELGGECGANTYTRLEISNDVTQKCVSLVDFGQGLAPQRRGRVISEQAEFSCHYEFDGVDELVRDGE